MASHLVLVEVGSIEMRADEPAKAAVRVRAAPVQSPGVLQKRDGGLVAGHRARRHDARRSMGGVGVALPFLKASTVPSMKSALSPPCTWEIDETRGHGVRGGVDRRS